MNLLKSIIYDTIQLGQLIRSERKASGITLQQTSAMSNIGVRFLSELERGKATAEIGKVISALHTVGLDMAVVQKPPNYQIKPDTTNSVNEPAVKYSSRSGNTLSEQLDLEFPYEYEWEWSRQDIDNTTFIRLVLARTRFDDILRISHHFGIDRIEDETHYFRDAPQYKILKKLLSHIHSGIEIAKNSASRSES